MTRTFLLAAALASGLGCSDPESARSPSPTGTVGEARAEDEAPVDDEALPGEEEAEELAEPDPLLDLDTMERSELEAACFQGSQAACDRLGH